MSDKGSVFQKGGGGTNFEQAVQSAFLTTLIIKGNVPCFPSAELIEIAFQTTNRGYKTDDLLAIARSDIGQHRLLAQIKHNLTFSDSDTNTTFKEVISAFWRDFNNTSLFDKDQDRLLVIKSGLTQAEKNHLKPLFNWAKTHANEVDFLSEVDRIKEKKERFEIFRSVLKYANSGNSVSDKEIWEFFKCLDILEYDFLNEGSIDETYFINLIKISKSDSTTSNEKEIWDSIYAYTAKHNKDGGSVTIDSIKNQEIYKHFDVLKLSPYANSIRKLKNDSEVILEPLKNTISGFHLERKTLYSSIVNSINDFPLTFVTGNPGVGKSATVKDILSKDFSNASVFVFRADQFNEPHLANVLSKLSVHEPIQDIISCLSLIPDKILVVDGLEKLLEGDPDNAFKQLLSILAKFPDIKIVATSRKYAVDLIIQKFGIDTNTLNLVTIEVLTEAELKAISDKFPALNQVFQNKKLTALLRSPKYLEFAITSLDKASEDYSNISITNFKKKLWNNIIEDVTTKRNGLAQKRSIAFSNIAIKRAKKMRLFVEPDDNVDSAAIEALEKDEVLFQERDEYRFSPTHDILEDWALVKYVNSKYDASPNPKDLFNSLGAEPAIRRAFRLWIEDYLIDDSEKTNDLIRATLADNSIDRYWADEVLIAILKSDNCKAFFESFEKKLLETDGSFLNRCIHILRTSCKENYGSSLLLPVGSGWKEAIIFIKQHLAELDNLRLLIIYLLFDWENRLLFQRIENKTEVLAPKEIVIYYINQIESGDEFWQHEAISKRSYRLISLLYNLSASSKSEITELIKRAVKAKEDRANWTSNSFYEIVIAKCLSGLDTRILAYELPELIVQTAWKEWKLKDRKAEPGEYSHTHFRSSALYDDECWGINNKNSFFPSGIYKTPIYHLLNFHPAIGLKFVTEFINYSVDFYVNGECDYKHEIDQVLIELNDGTKVKLWAAWELWVAYRGFSVTHYGLESLLMCLEKYLLEMAGTKTELSKKNLQFMFGYLLRNSNNVAIPGLLTSVAFAYPEEVEKEMLPLFSVKEFYEWDLKRGINESSALSPMDDKIPFAQEERHKSNQLPHRRM